ncbi:MAG: hypothetical protein M5U32_11520 [Myxococcota bacterium]|nr:hypothetical protein [Myxococcota bacterium]
MADRRLDPLDEARRLWMLLTPAERTAFLAWVLTAPPTQRPGDPEADR